MAAISGALFFITEAASRRFRDLAKKFEQPKVFAQIYTLIP